MQFFLLILIKFYSHFFDETALLIACTTGNIDIIKQLLSYEGIDVNIKGVFKKFSYEIFYSYFNIISKQSIDKIPLKLFDTISHLSLI